MKVLKSSRLLLLVVAATFGLTLSACGGSSDEDSPSTSTSSQEDAAPSPEPTKELTDEERREAAICMTRINELNIIVDAIYDRDADTPGPLTEQDAEGYFAGADPYRDLMDDEIGKAYDTYRAGVQEGIGLEGDALRAVLDQPATKAAGARLQSVRLGWDVCMEN